MPHGREGAGRRGPEGPEPGLTASGVTHLRKAEWVFYAKKPFGGPQAVLARARAKPLSLSALTPQTSPRDAPPARQSPYSPAERLPQPLQSKLIKPAAATKSP
jgi:hypothetical protein